MWNVYLLLPEPIADGDFDAAEIDKDLISARLKQDVLEHSGKIHLYVADSVCYHTVLLAIQLNMIVPVRFLSSSLQRFLCSRTPPLRHRCRRFGRWSIAIRLREGRVYHSMGLANWQKSYYFSQSPS